MGIDSNSLLTSVGAFSATVAAISIYANTASYYGTKYKLKRLSQKYGSDYAEEVLNGELEARKPFWTNFVGGGAGIKLLAKRLRN